MSRTPTGHSGEKQKGWKISLPTLLQAEARPFDESGFLVSVWLPVTASGELVRQLGAHLFRLSSY